MKHLFALIAVILWIASPGVAQTVKDPQQELTRLQEKVKTLQSADQQLKGQVASMKKDQEMLAQEVQSSLAAGDSVMKAGLDSIRVANDRGLRNEQADASLRSSLSLQQNLVIIALVLAVCLLLLFIWQRRMVRTLAQLHDADVKKLESMTEKRSAEMAAKIAALDEGLSSKIVGLQASLSDQSKRTEERFCSACNGTLVGYREHAGGVAPDLRQDRFRSQVRYRWRKEIPRGGRVGADPKGVCRG